MEGDLFGSAFSLVTATIEPSPWASRDKPWRCPPWMEHGYDRESFHFSDNLTLPHGDACSLRTCPLSAKRRPPSTRWSWRLQLPRSRLDRRPNQGGPLQCHAPT